MLTMAPRMLLTLLLVTSSYLCMAGAVSFDYCRFTPSHILCQEGIGPSCGSQIRERGVTTNEAKLILRLMNQLRSRVALGQEHRGFPGPQPSAANMGLLEWDDELARLAQGHADKCVFQHECQECRRVARFETGQTLFNSMAIDLDLQREWPLAIHFWYDEVALFSRHHINPFQHIYVTGHYTQMLWATTTKVGCGYSLFQRGSWWEKLYICNYGPNGNIIPGVVYKEGPACSACPQGTSCSKKFPGLCGSRSASANAPSFEFMSQQLASSGLLPLSQVKSPVNEAEKTREKIEEMSPAPIMEKFLEETFMEFTIPFKDKEPKPADLLPFQKQVGSEILTSRPSSSLASSMSQDSS